MHSQQQDFWGNRWNNNSYIKGLAACRMVIHAMKVEDFHNIYIKKQSGCHLLLRMNTLIVSCNIEIHKYKVADTTSHHKQMKNFV